MNYAIYVLHALCWLPFVVRGAYEAVSDRKSTAAAPAPAPTSAPNPSGLVFLHSIGLFILYFGVGYALPNDIVGGPVLQAFGAAVVIAGGALSTWTLLVFRSWKLRAVLAADHQLCIEGPFAWFRHPIYMALNLMAIGTALWSPFWLVWVGVVAVIVTGDIRARAEEQILTEVFGGRYLAYMRNVPRWIPGVY